MLSQCYHELIERYIFLEKYKGTCLIIDDNILDKELDKTKKTVDIETFDDTEILIDTNNKLSDDITLKDVLM